MADITISDLELAPALADDMVFPVENTTDTYAATLAMLRRLINKTFVEVEDADFNDLTDDGFYQCTGTPTNSPEAGAINWTLQVSAESGVVVQRAFSLDDNFANLYIRRWNGVTWTGWLDVGKGALDNKANVSNTVTTDTEQTISGAKTFSTAPVMTEALTATENSTKIPTTTWVQSNIGVVNYAGGSNIGATIRASSGTGYKPTKKGILVIKENNVSSGINTLYIYNSGGTQVTSFKINSVAGASGASSTVIVPVSPNFSYRTWGGNGIEMEHLFFPYYSG